MASINANGSNGHHKFTFNVNEISTSTENNNGVLSTSFQLSALQNGYDWNWYNKISYELLITSINDNEETVTHLRKTGYINEYSGSGTLTISSGNVTVDHNTDGTKKINFSFKVIDSTGQSYTCGNASASGELKLTDLHKPPIINSVTITEGRSGIPNDVFVNFLSQKTFNFNTTTFDDATIKEYSVLGTKSVNNNFEVSIGNLGTGTSVSLNYNVVDTLNGVGTLIENKTLIPYFKPTFVNTDTTVKRDGQTSGRAVLNAKGNFYNSNIGTLTQFEKPKVFIKFWNKNDIQPMAYTEIPSDNISVNGNEFTINNYLLGSDFDYRSSYNVKLYVRDAFYQSAILSKSIPIGEATWTEYKDRVDFKKISIGNTAVDDYVIEKGDNYIKWASGKLEQWKSTYFDNLSIDQKVVENLYYGIFDLGNWEIPFSEAPVRFAYSLGQMITFRAVWVGGATYENGVYQNPTETSCGSIYVYCPYTTSFYGSVNIYAVGKWK